MNNLISSILTMTLGIFLTFTAAPAAERVKVFELAESGILIEFPMNAEEIAAEDAEKARRAAEWSARAKAPQKRLGRIELAESGVVIEFPMSAEEIAAEDAENARRAAMQAMRTHSPRKQVVLFELAESGQTIEFPAITTPAVQGFQDKEIATENANSGDGLIKVR